MTRQSSYHQCQVSFQCAGLPERGLQTLVIMKPYRTTLETAPESGMLNNSNKMYTIYRALFEKDAQHVFQRQEDKHTDRTKNNSIK